MNKYSNHVKLTLILFMFFIEESLTLFYNSNILLLCFFFVIMYYLFNNALSFVSDLSSDYVSIFTFLMFFNFKYFYSLRLSIFLKYLLLSYWIIKIKLLNNVKKLMIDNHFTYLNKISHHILYLINKVL
jgi:hypothetical protein